MTAMRLSELSDSEMRSLTGTTGMHCDKCGKSSHNTAGHEDPGEPDRCSSAIRVGGLGDDANNWVRCIKDARPSHSFHVNGGRMWDSMGKLIAPK